MSLANTTHDSAGPTPDAESASRRALLTFRIGAWSWLITGVGHLLLTAALRLRPATPAGERAVAAMREHGLELAGLRRSLYDINQGMSLVMAVALIFGGVTCLLVARSAPDLVTQSRSLSGLSLAASVATFGVSLWLLPAPPIVLFAVACVTYGWSCVAARPPSAGQASNS